MTLASPSIAWLVLAESTWYASNDGQRPGSGDASLVLCPGGTLVFNRSGRRALSLYLLGANRERLTGSARSSSVHRGQFRHQ